MSETHAQHDDVDALASSSEGARVETLLGDLCRLRGEVANLANLYVTSVRLHEACGRDEVLTVVQEIVISLVGSEEFGIFELDAGRERLIPSAVFGLSPELVRWVATPTGSVAACLADGEMRVRTDLTPLAEGPGEQLNALVPLRLHGSVTGLVAVFAMLPHKARIGSADLALLQLLATHAWAAVDYAELRARARQLPTDDSTRRGAP